MRAESIPSKDVYVFFILRRRVQRYCTAVRGDKNKKHIHRRHKFLFVRNKMCPRLPLSDLLFVRKTDETAQYAFSEFQVK